MQCFSRELVTGQCIDAVADMAQWTLDHAVDLGMLPKSKLEDGTLRVTGKWQRSYGGANRKRGTYVSLNLGGTVFGPSIPGMERLPVPNTSRMTQRKRQAMFANRQIDKGRYVFPEYASIADKPGIGTMVSDDPLDCFAALVAHEVAHAVGYCTFKRCYRDTKHGTVWQGVYRELRRALLDHRFTTATKQKEAA